MNSSMTKEMYEKLKNSIWDNGIFAIDDLLGYEVNINEDKDVIENRMDMVLDQMPKDIALQYYHKYVENQ